MGPLKLVVSDRRSYLQPKLLFRVLIHLTGAFALLIVANPTFAQAPSDCKEAGGIYGDCPEPDLGPWTRYRIWGGTGLLNGAGVPNDFPTETAALACANSAIETAQIWWSKWCSVTWSDQRGNRIDYTLDAMGNRITEKTKDPGGVLVGNIARVIDALNRIERRTGAQL